MKKTLITAALILTGAAAAQADPYVKINKGIQGLLLGAGGGALAGQAIGRNTESTLIGTTLGTLVGYMVGNEMDKNALEYREVGYRPYEPEYRVRPGGYRQEPLPTYSAAPAECREVEILGTVHGDPQRLLGTACLTGRGWVLVDPPPVQATGYRYSQYGSYPQDYGQPDGYSYSRPVSYRR